MAISSQRLATRILWGLLAGVIAGVLASIVGSFEPVFLEWCRQLSESILDPIGQIFLRMLFFVVVPLVFASLALGVVQLGELRRLGPLALRTGALFALNMAIGVALGLLVMNVVRPGHYLGDATKASLMAQFGGAAAEKIAVHEQQPGLNLATLVEMFMPRNLLQSVVDFQLLPLILFAMLVGMAGTQLADAHRLKLQEGLGIVAELMTRIVHYALLLAPVAVPAMIFSVIVKSGLSILLALGAFVAAVLTVMCLHLFGTMSVWLKLFTRRSPLKFFYAIRAILVTAFSTSSSNATLPTSLQVSREQLGLSQSTTGFVLPLGATMNMSGTALYEGCVVLFIAQIYGVELSLARQITLLILTVFSAVAVAGIPGGSLPLIAGLLISFGIPAEALSIIIGIDRILDMARTTVNVGADVVTACVVDEQTARAQTRPARPHPH